MTDAAIFKALDAAVNKVVREHFDLYFDRKEADRIITAWMKERLAKIAERTTP